MNSIDLIKAPITSEFYIFEGVFNSAFSEEEELIKKVLEHVKDQKGKQVRPIFTILCAKLCGTPTNDTFNIAAGYEVLHTATLIHDDVVDNTLVRRNKPSVNALFDNKTAVLVGDYLLTKSMEFIYRANNHTINKQFAKLGSTLARGELLQLQYAFSIPKEEDYIEIIRKKTAVLFSVCALSGGISVGATEEQLDALQNFAECVGICFQIKDDIFDYTPNAEIGKPTLNDIREGKITLPLLHAIQQLSQNEAAELLNKIKECHFTENFFYNIGSLVARNKGIEYSIEKMNYYREMAVESLEIFDNNECKEALINMLDYVINRKK